MVMTDQDERGNRQARALVPSAGALNGWRRGRGRGSAKYGREVMAKAVPKYVAKFPNFQANDQFKNSLADRLQDG